MDIYVKRLRHGARIAVLKADRDETFYLQHLTLTAAEHGDLKTLQGVRRQEWLASRWLLHQISGYAVRLPLAKDAFSKPFFEAQENLLCSLSHSRGTVAAMILNTENVPRRLASHFSCGCDLQRLEPKMQQIAPRFMSKSELEWVHEQPEQYHLLLLHFFWTAKESLYKSWGRKELDFRAHLRFSHLVLKNRRQVRAVGYIEKSGAPQVFDVFAQQLNVGGDEYLLAYCFTKA